MKYIKNTLGIEVIFEPWDGMNKLPHYLNDRYIIKKMTLGGVNCLFMKPKGELDTLTAVKKHIINVEKVEPLPIVLELDSMTARRRKSLIDARIPFVAPECHIYLPFLGIALNERYSSTKTPGKNLCRLPSFCCFIIYTKIKQNFL